MHAPVSLATLAASVAALLLVAGCGESRSTRVITGAAGGAVAGEVIADEPVAGAVIGGTAGALRP
jgi:osmotically inducible lipoprotein OsmB